MAPEFDAFRDHLSGMGSEFTKIAQIASPAVVQARLQLLAERDLRRPLAEIERGLRRLMLAPARAVIGFKSQRLPLGRRS